MVDDPVLRMALAAHTQMIKALMDWIDGDKETSPNIVHDNGACAIDRWLAGDGACYADLPAYARAKELHDQFHQMVQDIVLLLDAGAKAEALAKLRGGSSFARLSRQMLFAFEELSDAISAAARRD